MNKKRILEKDLIGKQYERLTILKEAKSKRTPLGVLRRFFLCKCECGNEVIVRLNDLKTGAMKSCGCLRKEQRITHNMSYSFIYRAYRGMRSRCLDSNSPSFKYYGGRGILICKEWMTFEGFYKDMGTTYRKGLTLERINVNDNYCKENCIWIPKRDQMKNTRKSRIFLWKNKSLCLTDICKLENKNYGTVRSRLKKGLSIFEALL
jgi:hypothetical protein